MEIKIISYAMLNKLNTKEKLNNLLDELKKGYLLLLEGKLKPDEETLLIEETMKNINKKFSGIEIAYLDYISDNQNVLSKLKNAFIKLLLKNRIGITIIGPSKIVKEIKQDPLKIDVLLNKSK